MPVIKSEFACPRCKKQSGASSQIVANAGELQCSVNPDHRWNDTLAFYEEGPTMEFKVEMPKALPQQNHTPYQVSIPIGLKEQLETKYGDKTGVTVASILMQMVEGNIMIVGQTDLDRIGSKLGKTPANSSELFGMIYAKTEEVAEAKMMMETAQKDLKAYEGLSVGRVVVDLGEQYGEAVDKARSAELPLKLWIEQSVKNGIANNWF